MAKYTMELRDVVAHYNIFNFPYPIYDEKKRPEVEESFIRHFYFREIGVDTPDMFIWFLRDKFNLVFPYYNELMRTATIEYDIENPYNLTETYKRKTDSSGKSNTAAYAVGHVTEDQTGTADETRKDETTGTSTGRGTSDQKETTSSETEGFEEGNTAGTRSETVNAETTGNRNNTDNLIEKFHDTPQSKLNLNDSDYLTHIKQNDNTGSVTERGTNNQSTNGNTSEESERHTEGTSETVRNLNGSTTDEQSRTETTETNGKTETHANSEQKSTNDSNTRSESIGNQVEEYELIRKGNIGANPASYEIDMHIKTQQTLKRILEMFFNECEDLFMGVY